MYQSRDLASKPAIRIPTRPTPPSSFSFLTLLLQSQPNISPRVIFIDSRAQSRLGLISFLVSSLTRREERIVLRDFRSSQQCNVRAKRHFKPKHRTCIPSFLYHQPFFSLLLRHPASPRQLHHSTLINMFSSFRSRNRVSKTVKPIKRSMGERSKLKMQQKLDTSMAGRYDDALHQELGQEG